MRPRIQTPRDGPWHDRPPNVRRQPALRSQRHVARASAVVCVVLVGVVGIGPHVPGWIGALVALRRPAVATEAPRPLADLLRDVEAASESGASDEIARSCAAFIAAYPDHPVAEPASLRLVQARIRLGEVRGAERAFLDFRHRYPRSPLLPEGLLDVASWCFRRGAYRDAANAYTDLVASVTSADGSPAGEDTVPELVIWRSKALWNAHKRAERSRTELERLARFNQALSWEHGGDREAALRAYDRFLSRFPQDAFGVEARFRMANLLLAEGRTEEALAAYRAVYADPLAAVAFRCESAYRAGRTYQSARRFDEAIAAYGQAQPLQPTGNEFRLAALGELAQLLETRDRARALVIYRELATSNALTEVRAAAQQRLRALETEGSDPTVRR